MTTPALTLELGPEDTATRCNCCGKESRTVHGFLYKNGDAYSIYYAGWSEGHHDRGVTMAIAIGEWGDDSKVSDRISIGIEARTTETQIQFAVLNPEESPWGKTELIGEMLRRQEALNHSILKQIFEVAECIVKDDTRIRAFLEKKEFTKVG